MEMYYAWMQQWLPFEWAQYSFMLNALLAVLLVTPLFAILGTMVVNNKMAFFSFAILLAIGISLVKAKGKSSPDTIVGVFSSAAVALGIVILSRGGGFAKYSNFLIGDLLSISTNQILMLVVVLFLVLLFWAVFFNQLLLVSV